MPRLVEGAALPRKLGGMHIARRSAKLRRPLGLRCEGACRWSTLATWRPVHSMHSVQTAQAACSAGGAHLPAPGSGRPDHPECQPGTLFRATHQLPARCCECGSVCSLVASRLQLLLPPWHAAVPAAVVWTCCRSFFFFRLLVHPAASIRLATTSVAPTRLHAPRHPALPTPSRHPRPTYAGGYRASEPLDLRTIPGPSVFGGLVAGAPVGAAARRAAALHARAVGGAACSQGGAWGLPLISL